MHHAFQTLPRAFHCRSHGGEWCVSFYYISYSDIRMVEGRDVIMIEGWIIARKLHFDVKWNIGRSHKKWEGGGERKNYFEKGETNLKLSWNIESIQSFWCEMLGLGRNIRIGEEEKTQLEKISNNKTISLLRWVINKKDYIFREMQKPIWKKMQSKC